MVNLRLSFLPLYPLPLILTASNFLGVSFFAFTAAFNGAAFFSTGFFAAAGAAAFLGAAAAGAFLGAAVVAGAACPFLGAPAAGAAGFFSTACFFSATGAFFSAGVSALRLA